MAVPQINNEMMSPVTSFMTNRAQQGFQRAISREPAPVVDAGGSEIVHETKAGSVKSDAFKVTLSAQALGKHSILKGE